jgi:hypothetical protein
VFGFFESRLMAILTASVRSTVGVDNAQDFRRAAVPGYGLIRPVRRAVGQ